MFVATSAFVKAGSLFHVFLMCFARSSLPPIMSVYPLNFRRIFICGNFFFHVIMVVRTWWSLRHWCLFKWVWWVVFYQVLSFSFSKFCIFHLFCDSSSRASYCDGRCAFMWVTIGMVAAFSFSAIMKPWIWLLTWAATRDTVLADLFARISGCSQPRGSLNCTQSISLLTLIYHGPPVTLAYFRLLLLHALTGTVSMLTLLWCIFPRTFSSLMMLFNCFPFAEHHLHVLRHGLQETCRAAFAAGTHKNHQTQWRAFLLFCSYFQLCPMPASLKTLALYSQFLSHSMIPASVRNYLSGLKLLHLLVGENITIFKSYELTIILRGLHRSGTACA